MWNFNRKYLLLTSACVLILWAANINKRNPNLYKTVTTPDEDVRNLDVSQNLQNNRHMVLYNETNHGESCQSSIFSSISPRRFASDSLWMPVGENRPAFVYSAYHVIRNRHKIVIVGALAYWASEAICQLWYEGDNPNEIYIKEVPVSLKQATKPFRQRYISTLFECTIDSGHVPKYVSLVTASCDVPKHLLTVQTATNPPNYSRNFTVCLSPMNRQYSKAFDLVEWIEMNKILGADKFIVYNHSIANNVARVLDYYSRRGIVEVLPWNIPLSVPFFPKQILMPEIHYFGQVAALNDCLYRNKQMSEFVVNVDIDEFIIPHSTNLQTWYDLVNVKQQKKSVYMFRSTCFKERIKTNSSNTKIGKQALIDKYNLVTLQKLHHESYIFLPNMRSKYLARTSEVFKIMIHDVPGYDTEHVPTNIALLHHYRNLRKNKNAEDTMVYDNTVPVKYGDRLISRVDYTWNKIGNEVGQ